MKLLNKAKKTLEKHLKRIRSLGFKGELITK